MSPDDVHAAAVQSVPFHEHFAPLWCPGVKDGLRRTGRPALSKAEPLHPNPLSCCARRIDRCTFGSIDCSVV
jgi:hypothetical protein